MDINTTSLDRRYESWMREDKEYQTERKSKEW